MGVIQRQGIKQSIISYIALAIGALSSLFIYPLDYSTYGLSQTLVDLVVFLTPIVTFGAGSLMLRFFPRFYEGGKENGFLGFVLIVALICSLVFSLAVLLFGDSFMFLLEKLGFDLVIFETYRWPILAFLAVYILTNILDKYIRSHNRIVIQAVFTNLLFKIGLPILIILVYRGDLSIYNFVWCLTAMYVLGFLGLVVYASINTAFDLKFWKIQIPLNQRKEMATYASFAVFGTMGTILATQMDSLMISTLLDTTYTGIYKITAFMALVIEIPARSLRAIASPVISRAWESEDREEVSMIYTRSSAILGTLGTAMFVLLAVNIEEIINFTPNPIELLDNLSVFYILGLAHLVDMFTGVNSQIITYSDYFRFNIVTILLLAVFNLVFNYLFIKYYGWGITGVAFATFLSLSAYNLIKYLYLYYRLQLQPFSFETLKILIIGLLSFGLGSMIDLPWHPLIGIVVKSVIIGSCFGLAVWYSGVCPEVKDLARNLLDKFKK